MIIDASALLCAFFQDEAQEAAQTLLREHAAGRIRLSAPTLLIYEANNAVWQAERRGRIARKQADEILQAIHSLQIGFYQPEWVVVLAVARKYNCSAYDAAYLALAHQLDKDLITADERFFNIAAEKRVKLLKQI